MVEEDRVVAAAAQHAHRRVLGARARRDAVPAGRWPPSPARQTSYTLPRPFGSGTVARRLVEERPQRRHGAHGQPVPRRRGVHVEARHGVPCERPRGAASPHSVEPVSVNSSASQMPKTSVRRGRCPGARELAERARPAPARWPCRRTDRPRRTSTRRDGSRAARPARPPPGRGPPRAGGRSRCGWGASRGGCPAAGAAAPGRVPRGTRTARRPASPRGPHRARPALPGSGARPRTTGAPTASSGGSRDSASGMRRAPGDGGPAGREGVAGHDEVVDVARRAARGCPGPRAPSGRRRPGRSRPRRDPSR